MAASTLRHKHIRIDQAKLSKARQVLEARADTETLDRALDIVVSEAEIDSMLRTVRVLTPTRQVFADAGDTLRRLRAVRGYNPASSHGIANDVLIALSARSIGASVVTQNENDFVAIRSVRPFGLRIVAG
jgi:predicted nucleic acid-binding protein